MIPVISARGGQPQWSPKMRERLHPDFPESTLMTEDMLPGYLFENWQHQLSLGVSLVPQA